VDDVVEAAREVDLVPVRQVAALVEAERHHRVARVEEREVDGHVGLRAGVRLHVGVLGSEQLLRAIDRELLDLVDDLAAAVVAPAGISLGVLVREDRAGRVEHGLGHEVLRRDHLERVLLALELALQNARDVGIDLSKRCGLEIVGKRVHVSHSTATRRCPPGSGALWRGPARVL
jgi:hypothetical protein